MTHKFWIGFYAFSLCVLGLMFLAVAFLTVSAWVTNQKSWLSWLWVPPILFGPAWLLWITWRLLRREIARGKISE